jgi:SSS family solute:Na+ symporter
VRPLDWLVLGASLSFIVLYGLWKGRRMHNLDQYLLADRRMRWYTIAVSIMATQASAITFLSTPGQAFTDGMRFIQFYLGLPIAMVILAITAVPIYRRLKVYTAYEYLEGRFDTKTRLLAAGLFLIQRGVSTGITIYAPSLIISVLLGWNIYWTNAITGVLVIIYTAFGGTKAVSWTHMQQMLVILCGMGLALIVVMKSIPHDVSVLDAVRVAGRMGRLNAIDFHFDLTSRYNFWSGLIGGLFVALSYFGTDQSQVQRYLGGASVTQSRLGLLFNGLIKVPMQFFILFVGAMVFVFYQFVAPPLSFNSVEQTRIRETRYAREYAQLEGRQRTVFVEKRDQVRALIGAMNRHDPAAVDRATTQLRETQKREAGIRSAGAELIRKSNPASDGSDTNYVFLAFVIRFLPAGVVGLVMAAIFCASMSSTASGLNSLASTTIIDVYKRLIEPDRSEQHYVHISKIFTILWGVFAVGVAFFANRVGSLIEAVNILGSLFYGTILGIFLLAFYFKQVGGTAAFIGALAGEAVVVYCWKFTPISYLWYNVIGCAVGIAAALLITALIPNGDDETEPEAELSA